MKNLFRKGGAALTLVAAAIMATAAIASAGEPDPTPTDAIETGAQTLSDGLIGIAVVVLPLAFGIALIPLGYRWVRKFIK